MRRPTAGAVRQDLTAVQEQGVDTVLSLLDPSEAVLVGLVHQAGICAELGMTFLTHPVPDMQLPLFEPFEALLSNLSARLDEGAHIAVHCHASIGRSGILACCLLGRQQGISARDAIARVSIARGVPVPDTDEQVDFIRRILEQPSPA